MDAQRDCLSVRLFSRDPLDVYDVLEPIDGCDFALAAFVGSADYGHFVVFTDGDRADLVLDR